MSSLNSHVSQFYCVKLCNCSMDLLFPTAKYPQCNITDFFCLDNYNDMLNAEKSDDGEPGIECSCLPECSRIDYGTELQPIYQEKEIDANFVLIDVHFADETTLKYRTDVTFSEMDLIVGFGGIVSLFLGSSIMSLVEVIYFSTIALIKKYLQKRKIHKTKFDNMRPKLAYLN